MANKLSAFVGGVLALIIIGGGAWLWYNFQEQQTPSVDDTIVKFELQTHELHEDLPKVAKYRVSTNEELQKFYNTFSDAINADTKYLEHHDLFIEIHTENSGSIKHALDNVNFNNNTVNFEISTTSPGIGTDDMATWYFVAVIPKEKVKTLNVSDWQKL